MRRSTNLFSLYPLALLLVSTALCAPGASAQAINDPPPSGAILDLNGQTINHGTAVGESAEFTASVASTDITFAFREDPAFISFGDVTLVDLTNPSGNLILNGTFASGSGSSATDWDYANIYGATFGGVVASDCSGGLATCWYDGAVQAYDAIDQYVATTVGDVYQLSFDYSDTSALSTFSSLSTNGDVTDTGGNGVDILAYAQAGLPPPGVTPEPDSIWLMSTGVLMLGVAFYYKRRNGFGSMNF